VIWEEDNIHVATTKVNGTITAALGQSDSKLQLTVPYQSLGVPLYVLPTNMTPPLDRPVMQSAPTTRRADGTSTDTASSFRLLSVSRTESTADGVVAAAVVEEGSRGLGSRALRGR